MFDERSSISFLIFLDAVNDKYIFDNSNATLKIITAHNWQATFQTLPFIIVSKSI